MLSFVAEKNLGLTAQFPYLATLLFLSITSCSGRGYYTVMPDPVRLKVFVSVGTTLWNF